MKKIILTFLLMFYYSITSALVMPWLINPAAPQLTVTVNGNGTITSSPAGISCPGTCSASFSNGATVTLTATAASSNASSTVHGTGSELYNWGGTKCTGTSTASNCSFTFSGATDAAATFTPKDSDVWWISPGGSDSNTGRSRTSPFATLNHVLPLMSAGDTLYFDDGTYAGQSLGGNGGSFSTNLVSGTSVKSTRFFGWTRSLCSPSCASGTASATIDGQYTKLPIYIWRSSNIEIGYLRAIHSASGPIDIDGSSNGTGSALTVTCSGGAVGSISIAQAGSGFSANSSWLGAIWGGGITGAQYTITTTSGGALSTATVTNGGSGCTQGTTLASADIRASNIYIHDTGAGYSLPGSSGANIFGAGSNRCNGCVFERDWSWGYGARYPFALYSGVNNIVRESVSRYDGAPDGQPKAGIVQYDEDHSIVENSIVLDFDNGTDSTADVHAPLFTTSSVTNSTYPYGLGTVSWYGNIAINTVATSGNGGFYYDSHSSMYSDITGTTIPTFTAYDNAVIGVSNSSTAGGLWISADTTASTRGSAHDIILNHNTVYGSNGNGVRLDSYSYNSVTMKNMLVDGGSYTSAGCYNQQYAGTPTTAANLWWNCNNTLHTVMPNATNADPAFVWIPDITSGPAYNTGNPSGNIGATIVNKYVNGSLTGTTLWPFPNEAVIKDDLCQGPDTSTAGTCEAANNTSCTIYTRGHNTSGFCASGKSLTKYIWEYLGNTSPY
jgi:hypothetical protein